MQIPKSSFCGACLNIKHRKLDGTIEDMRIQDWLECEGYKTSFGAADINNSMLFRLQENGGCSKCINVLKNAGATW